MLEDIIIERKSVDGYTYSYAFTLKNFLLRGKDLRVVIQVHTVLSVGVERLDVSVPTLDVLVLLWIVYYPLIFLLNFILPEQS